ncbi:hypothetical protein B296_00047871 [Ensete ventricosum]|uniref:Uncharacterized protein n=1 Tax=Ensete ventricosum TaxID=4639 RepID=A0A426XU99_ENSVE|nr:hypothetical protein B296_00047871 [Ensete ventricosum]
MSGTYRYVDRPLLGGSVKNRSSAVDFGRRRPIEEEIDRRRSIVEEKGKKKSKRKKKRRGEERIPRPCAVLARLPSPPVGRRPRVACCRFFSCTRRWSVSPRGEKDRGDVAPFSPFS